MLPTDGAIFKCLSEGATVINSNSESSTEARRNGLDKRAEIFAIRLLECGESDDLLYPDVPEREPEWFAIVRVMRTLRPGREATIIEVHISAVHMTAVVTSVRWS